MTDNKEHLLDIYRQVFDTWESYTHKVIDMMLLTPLLWEQAGKFLETVSKLQTRHSGRMFEDFTVFLTKNNGVLGATKNNRNVYEKKISTLESNEVGQLLAGAIEKIKHPRGRGTVRRKIVQVKSRKIN
jgi:hypothetical protein